MTTAMPLPTASQSLSPAEQTVCERLGLTIGEAGAASGPWYAWSDAAFIERGLACHGEVKPAMDARARGAFLLNRLSFDLGALVAWLDLAGYSLDEVHVAQLRVQPALVDEEHEGEWYRYVRYRLAIDKLVPATLSLSADFLGQQVVQLFQPVVGGVAKAVRLSPAALWRLVTDGVSASYLNVGKELNRANDAMQRSQALIQAAGKPLQNKQWAFRHYEVDASDRPDRQPLGEWFRVRGGCCRYYTFDNNDYCTTCVHLDEPERRARFQRYLCEQAKPE